MKMQNKVLFIGLVCLSLAGCGNGLKQELGVARNSPDEFTVVKKAPLSVPPEFNLVPPTNDAQERKDIAQKTPSETARQAMFGSTNAPVSGKDSTGDSAIAKKMKFASNTQNIRTLIDEDNGYIYIKNMSLVDKLVSKKDDVKLDSEEDDTMPTSVVDAPAEAKRIKDAKDAKKPINDGKVPTIEKKKNTLEMIF